MGTDGERRGGEERKAGKDRHGDGGREREERGVEKSDEWPKAERERSRRVENGSKKKTNAVRGE